MLKLVTTALFCAVTLAGCGLVYRVNVYQGNLLERKNVEQLRTGMSKRQVLVLLGSPSVADPFHQNRWDYLASVRKRRGDTDVKTLVLMFQGDTLTKISGEYFPEQDEALARELVLYGNLPREERNKRRAGR